LYGNDLEVVEFYVLRSEIEKLDVLTFDGVTDAWADFIAFHKRFGPKGLLHGEMPYDMVAGPMFRRFGKNGIVRAWPDRIQFSIHTEEAANVLQGYTTWKSLPE